MSSDNHVLIEAAHRFAKKAPPADQGWTPEKVRATFAPSVTALPFVTRKEGARIGDRPLTFWNDVPSPDSYSDFNRGKQFAAMTIEAIANDRCGGGPLEQIFGAIVTDAVRRTIKGGKGSRNPLTPAIDGFLCGLARDIADRLKKV